MYDVTSRFKEDSCWLVNGGSTSVVKDGGVIYIGFWKKSACYNSSDGSVLILNGLSSSDVDKLLVYVMMRARSLFKTR